MWWLNAYRGQRVVGLITLHHNGRTAVEKGRVYTVVGMYRFENTTYLQLDSICAVDVRFDTVSPVDESRLDVFRKMLKHEGIWGHAKNKGLDWSDA